MRFRTCGWVWIVEMRIHSGAEWMPVVFAASGVTLGEAREMAQAMHPDWEIGPEHGTYSRGVWEKET